MADKDILTFEDKIVIETFSDGYEEEMARIDKARQFKVGDYVVLYVQRDERMLLHTNSYGAPIKYQVVHSTKHGIPFVKKVNSKGEPVGTLYSCTGHLDSDTYTSNGKFEFKLDPDYADALILDDKYDPSVLHKTKKDIWNSVTEYNKSIKIHTHDIKNIVNFFHTVNVGDILWTSNKSHYLVRDKRNIAKADAKKIIKNLPYHRLRGSLVLVLTLVDKRGKEIDVTADFFYSKALYNQRPRSYNELKI